MPKEIVISTPENVEIRVMLAGLATRGCAFAIDLCIQGLAILILGFLFFKVLPDIIKILAIFGQAAGILLFFMVFWGYHIVHEVFFNGQTPGKRLMKIRVIGQSGRNVTFFASLIRNLLRIADFMPDMFLLGCVMIIFTKHGFRVGDYVAQTIVVRLPEIQIAPECDTQQPKESVIKRVKIIRWI